MSDFYIAEASTPESYYYYYYALGKWFWTSPAFWPYLYLMEGAAKEA